MSLLLPLLLATCELAVREPLLPVDEQNGIARHGPEIRVGVRAQYLPSESDGLDTRFTGITPYTIELRFAVSRWRRMPPVPQR